MLKALALKVGGVAFCFIDILSKSIVVGMLLIHPSILRLPRNLLTSTLASQTAGPLQLQSSTINDWKPLSAYSVTSDQQQLYKIVGDVVYTTQVESGGTTNEIPILGADASTFEVSSVDASYAKDKNTIYHDIGVPFAIADASTFRLLSDKYRQVSPSGSGGYAADASHAFCNGQIIPGADPNSIQLLQDENGHATDFAKDKSSAYYCIEQIPNADVDSFAAVSDKNGNWTGYMKDADHVFIADPLDGVRTVDGADPASFVAFNFTDGWHTGYGLDRSAVYYYGSVVAGANPATFQTLNTARDEAEALGYDAYDAKHRYYLGHMISAATDTASLPSM